MISYKFSGLSTCFLYKKGYFIVLKLYLAGHIKVLHGPDLARGPDVAQACTRRSTLKGGRKWILIKKMM
jgi:hypothetical protein